MRMPENRTLSFRAEMPGIGRIPGISDPESTFCPVLRALIFKNSDLGNLDRELIPEVARLSSRSRVCSQGS